LSLLASKPIAPVTPPPEYRNIELEEIIAENKGGSSLNLNRMRLSDQDMQIVAYYALRNNKVSVILIFFNQKSGKDLFHMRLLI
jgi:hypothetical protein